MDLDEFVVRREPEWRRLSQLARRARSRRPLPGAEADELVELYQRAATHLSMAQSAGADAVLVGRLSTLVAEARSAVTGTRPAAFADVARFLRVDFPALCYRIRWWWGGVAAVFLLVSTGYALLVAGNPAAQAAVGAPADVRQLVEQQFRAYYSSAPAQDFALRVFTNNSAIAAAEVASGILLGLPVIYLLYGNALNLGVAAGLLVGHGRGAEFFGLVLPHGLLELTAVFVAAGLGLRLGWTVVDPGARSRSQALAEEGRALVAGALGVALMLLCAGSVEAFVTPSRLPTAVRVGIGGLLELAFLGWVFGLGRRAVLAGRTGDLVDDLRGALAPTAG